MRALLSFAWLQIGWFACVLGPRWGVAWLGPVVVVGGLAVHVRAQAARGRELSLLAAVAVLGFAIDTALLRAGALAIAGATVSPLWLLALWPNFAATTAPGGSLHGLSARPALAALLGAVGGPAAYAGGARMGAITLGAPTTWALAVIGVVWAVFVPGLFAARGRLGQR
jgi:Protein of unknown function (DUF2878)